MCQWCQSKTSVWVVHIQWSVTSKQVLVMGPRSSALPSYDKKFEMSAIGSSFGKIVYHLGSKQEHWLKAAFATKCIQNVSEFCVRLKSKLPDKITEKSLLQTMYY